jgi:hypothetical protein
VCFGDGGAKHRGAKGDSHQIWRTQRVQVNLASLRLFLRSSTGPSRAFEPQSLGRRASRGQSRFPGCADRKPETGSDPYHSPLAAPFAAIFPAKLSAVDIHLLPLESHHIEPLTTLPFHHTDPFDRLIAATTLVEGLTLVSADTAFEAYVGSVRRGAFRRCNRPADALNAPLGDG